MKKWLTILVVLIMAAIILFFAAQSFKLGLESKPSAAASPTPTIASGINTDPANLADKSLEADADEAELEQDSEIEPSKPTPYASLFFPIPTLPMPQVSGDLEVKADLNAEHDIPHVGVVLPATKAERGLHIIGGLPTDGRSTPAPAGTASGTAKPSPTPGEPKPTRYGGQARGFTMIGLMHPRARLTSEAVVDVLLRANLEESFLQVLVDGSFSIDFDYLNSVIRRLNQDNRKLTLALYFSNGPTQRKHDETTISAAFNLIDPIFFRDFIQFDNKIRSEFQTILARANESFLLNKSLNPDNSNIAIMMLEDNLDSPSYAAMRKIAAITLPPDVEYVRNPCPGCYEGNDVSTLGDGLETHDPALLGILRPSDGFSLDGFGFLYPGETGTQLPNDQVQTMLRNSVDHGIRYFGLWRAGKQGLGPRGQINPDERDFEVPTENQKLAEIELLHAGLTPVEEPDALEEDSAVEPVP